MLMLMLLRRDSHRAASGDAAHNARRTGPGDAAYNGRRIVLTQSICGDCFRRRFEDYRW